MKKILDSDKAQKTSVQLARVLCFSPALYFLIGAAYAITHYADFGTAWPQFIRYVLAPLAIAMALFCVPKFVSHERAAQTGLSVVALLFSMFAVSVYVEFQKFRTFSTVRTQNATGTNGLPPNVTPKSVTLAIGNPQLESALLAGLPGTRVHLCRNQSGDVIYQADRYGFNNPESAYAKPVDVMMLGDSFLEGMCQSPGHDVTSVIRTFIPASVSLSMRGNGPLLELATLGRFGPVLRPKLTVFAFFEGNDWENLESEKERAYLADALNPATAFGAPNISVDQQQAFRTAMASVKVDRAGAIEIIARTSMLRNAFALHGAFALLGFSYPKVSQPDSDYLRVLERAKSLAAGWNGKIMIFYLPRVDRFTGLFANGFAYDSTRMMVRDAAAQAGIPLVDLVPVFQAQENPKLLFGPDSHFSDAGAALMAETVANAVTRDEALAAIVMNGSGRTQQNVAP